MDSARLKEVLDYNLETGQFHRRNQRGAIRCAGSLNNSGYRQIRIDGKLYVAHRLAWLWVHGSFPLNELDHINRDRDDNRIVNLREATRQQNSWNTNVSRNSKTGVLGVCVGRNGRYRAFIRKEGRATDLGYFDSIEEAANARKNASINLRGKFASESA